MEGSFTYFFQLGNRPGSPSIAQDLIFYVALQDSHRTHLQNCCLTFTYEIPASTTIISLRSTVQHDMKTSAAQWRFKETRSDRLARVAHEDSPLLLLRLTNKGNPNRSGNVRLTSCAIAPDMTLADLVHDADKFIGNAGRCIVHDHLVISFRKSAPPRSS
jgi:hypothetical protein